MILANDQLRVSLEDVCSKGVHMNSIFAIAVSKSETKSTKPRGKICEVLEKFCRKYLSEISIFCPKFKCPKFKVLSFLKDIH